jgi:hypothetical protein
LAKNPENSEVLPGTAVRASSFTALEWAGEMFSVAQESQLLRFKRTMSNCTPPLRVAVVHDFSQPSPWVDSLLCLLNQLPNAGVQAFPTSGRRAQKRPWPDCNQAVDEFLSMRLDRCQAIIRDNHEKYYILRQ